MPGQEADDGPGRALLDLAVSQPHAARTRAQTVLAGRPTAVEASYAHQALGIVRRDLGEPLAAVAELRVALRWARAAGDAGRVADVLASLAVALVLAGRTRAGLAAFEQALATAPGPARSRVLARRGAVLAVLGRHAAAVADLRTAAIRSARAGDPVWEGRALLSLVMSLLALGEVDRAETAARRAEVLFVEAGQQLEAAKAVHNLGLVAFAAGALPAALGHLARAEERYRQLGVDVPELWQERCAVLLAAGLVQQARDEVDDAVRRHPPPSVRAELLLAGAAAALADGDPGAAADRAREAERQLRRQHRPVWAARARFLAVAADAAAGGRPGLARAAGRSARELTEARADEAPLAHLLAARLSPGAAASRAHLQAAAAGLVGRPALGRATGELARALLARDAGDRAGLLRATKRGLAALDEHRVSLGAPELRALATGHGRELTALALQAAYDGGSARRLLLTAERSRATALALPGAGATDPVVVRELALLRDVSRRLDEARFERAPTGALARERSAAEQAVRRTRHAQPGPGPAGSRPVLAGLDLAALSAALGDTVLVELVEVGGRLVALTVDRGRVGGTEVGPSAAATTEVAHAGAALRRAAHGRPVDLPAVGRRLQDALLGPVARVLTTADRPVVVVPPARLHAAPWGLLPALSSVPVAVAPSAALWLRARCRPEPRAGRVTLVAGPGLGTGSGEVAELARLHPRATLLQGADATCDAVLAALDGARLAHVAAHGDFRSDSPTFSCLQLADGPLVVHDLERLKQPPYRLVLSACESAAAAAVGSDDLLGLATAVLGLGTAGVLAAVVAVHDEASVPVALSVHRALAAGVGLPAALLQARQDAAGDPLVEATAAACTVIGV